jgi:hypothetical protein
MKDELSYWCRERGELLLNFFLTRSLFALFCIAKYSYYRFFLRNRYLAISALLRYRRVISCIKGEKASALFSFLIINYNSSNVSIEAGRNRYIDSYIASKEAELYRREFRSYGVEHCLRMRYPKEADSEERQGDLLVLKPYMGKQENGVIFVQYNDSISKLCAIYDIQEMARYYRFVIEPSTWGYQDAAFLLLFGLETDVIIEAQYESDYCYIKEMGGNFYPIRLGAGDWVDPDSFKCEDTIEKKYDVIMVASWLKLKRHELLFNTVSRLGGAINRVALIGYPSSDRTMKDVIRESDQYEITHLIDFYENLSPGEVGELLRISKVSLMLSKREGANKAIYESFFSDVPVILSSSNVGVNRDHINHFTGMIAEDWELPEKVAYMVDNYKCFSPREWALKNTGYHNSNRMLNETVRILAVKNGERWTKDLYPKKNFSNAVYVNEADRREADEEVNKLGGFLRHSSYDL